MQPTPEAASVAVPAPTWRWLRWLESPRVNEPAEQMRVSALHAYAIASLIIAPMWNMVGHGLGRTPASWLAMVVSLLTLVLLRRGCRKLAGTLFLLFITGLTMANLWGAAGVWTPFVHALPIPVLVAASVFGAAPAMMMTLLGAGCVLTLAAYGDPALQVPGVPSATYGASVAATVVMVGAGVAFLSDHGRRVRRQTQAAAAELLDASRKSAAALRRQRALGDLGALLLTSAGTSDAVARVLKTLARETVAADREIAIVLRDPDGERLLRGYANAFGEEQRDTILITSRCDSLDDFMNEAFVSSDSSEALMSVPIGVDATLWGGLFVRGMAMNEDESLFVNGVCSLLVALLQRTELMTQHRAGLDKIAHSHRQVALGEIAVGITHEVNNPNSIIRLSSQLLRKNLRELRPAFEEAMPVDAEIGGLPGDEAMEILDDALTRIEKASRKVGEIAQSLGRFVGRHENHTPAPVDLNSAIDDALVMIGHQLRKRWRVIDDNREPIPKVVGHLSDLQLAVVNALSSIGSSKNMGARLEIRTSVDVTNNEVVFVAGFERQVGDDAGEADDESAGLSMLAVARHIAQEHGGRLEVDFARPQSGMVGLAFPVGAKNR